VTPFFNVLLVWNRGVTFGLLNDPGTSRWALIGISLVVVGALVFWLAKVAHTRLAVALGAIIGGAIGNVVDRLHHGAVVDFLDFHLAGAHWPVFNLADSGIVLGAGLMMWDAFFPPKP
jgi:signal peptidase II